MNVRNKVTRKIIDTRLTLSIEYVCAHITQEAQKLATCKLGI